MPWNETDPMNERLKFIAAYLEEEETFSELCDRFEISRKTGYKWVARYERDGPEALEDLSRTPHSHPHAVDKDVVQEILSARLKHPRWGPRKLLVVVSRRRPDLMLPAPSTVGEILKRNGLIGKRRRIRRSDPYGEQLREYNEPNAVWCADFKGHFAVGDSRCHPLTISDGYSRYLIRCEALRRPLTAPVKKVFESAFREYGLPNAIRTDNGAPFSTLAPAGLSRLAVWWIKLGIRPERIMPGRPDQNGRHERMHGTLKAETAKPPRSNFRAQQRAFDDFRYEYNYVRPHEALGLEVPLSRYCASPRRFPHYIDDPEYPDHFRVERAYPNGVASIDGVQWYVSHCLHGEAIGFEEIGYQRWKVYFGPVCLGIIDSHRAKKRGERSFGLLIPVSKSPHRKRYHY